MLCFKFIVGFFSFFTSLENTWCPIPSRNLMYWKLKPCSHFLWISPAHSSLAAHGIKLSVYYVFSTFSFPLGFHSVSGWGWNDVFSNQAVGIHWVWSWGKMNSMKDFYVCDSVSIHWFKMVTTVLHWSFALGFALISRSDKIWMGSEYANEDLR